jgi:hypothetical protein
VANILTSSNKPSRLATFLDFPILYFLNVFQTRGLSGDGLQNWTGPVAPEGRPAGLTDARPCHQVHDHASEKQEKQVGEKMSTRRQYFEVQITVNEIPIL